MHSLWKLKRCGFVTEPELHPRESTLTFHLIQLWKCILILFNKSILLKRNLWQTFGPKRNANGECSSLHNQELQSLYRWLNIVRVIRSRRLRCTSHVATMEKSRKVFKILTDKLRWKIPLGRRRRRRENNIRMNLKEIDVSLKNWVI